MDQIKKNFGFGCMRLPMKGDSVDAEEMNRMVDLFLESGFNYFDTAHGYLGGKSETALWECLTSRYPRDRYILTNKLTTFFFKSEAEIRPFFQSQLEACGVDYFDYYLMHAQSVDIFAKFKECRAYETALALKAEGKLRHFGISFHDRAEVLDQILTEYPQVEVVQIQLNYLDWDDPAVESRKCYEVCRKYGKPVFIMEPVKGQSGEAAGGGQSSAGRPARRKPRQLCHSFCVKLSRCGHGAVRHERYAADAGEHKLYAELYAAE